jgi:spermidine synthase
VSVQAGPCSPVEIALHAKVLRTMATVFADACSYPCNAAVYGRPLGFALGSDTPIAPRVAACTAELAGLRYCTPAVAAAVLVEPPYIRDAIRASGDVYTDAAPPVTHGAAGWEG